MKKLLVTVSIALLAFACAKEETIPGTQIEQEALDAWIQKHTTGFTRHDNGLYTKVLQAAPDGAAQPQAGGWVEINFTGYSLPDLPVNPTGRMFVTRDSALAAAYGTATLKTHYAPKKIYLSTQQTATTLTEAMLQTILMMRQGETREFYAPSTLTYPGIGTSAYTYGDWGYQGQSDLSAGVPSRMEIELVRVLGDSEAMLEDQNRQVEAFAIDRLGLSAADSLKANLYLKYTPLDPLADTIAPDSTCHIYYVGSFLDGFVFDTNIDSIAMRLWGDASHHDSLSYTPSSGGLIQAFYEAVDTMRYNSWGEMVFSSDWGYGYGSTPTVGDGVGGTEFDPYTPLYFKFFIAPKPVVADTTDSE